MEKEILLRLLLSVLWGGLVGAEREYHNKSAGFRTMILISIGSCLFTVLSRLIGGAENGDRIAANIVTGIGFLGVGVIFRGPNRINGITTAATIWSVAAVGMSIGSGYYFISSIASLLMLSVLAILPYAEERIARLQLAREYTIVSAFTVLAAARYKQLLQENHLKFKITRQLKTEENLHITLQVSGKPENHQQFINIILADPAIKRFDF